jgi:hypothetical protein
MCGVGWLRHYPPWLQPSPPRDFFMRRGLGPPPRDGFAIIPRGSSRRPLGLPPGGVLVLEGVLDGLGGMAAPLSPVAPAVVPFWGSIRALGGDRCDERGVKRGGQGLLGGAGAHTGWSMMRIVNLLIVVAAGLAAAEIPVETGSPLARLGDVERQAALNEGWQATTVALPEGHQRLDALVAACVAAKIDVRLEEGVDGSQALDFPGFRGPAWEALTNIATWFDLDFRPGIEHTGDQWWSRGDDGQSMPWHDGGLILCAPGPGVSSPRSVCGPLLVEVHQALLRRGGNADAGTLELALRLRIEPRSENLVLGEARVQWTQVTVDGQQIEPILENGDPERLGRMRLNGVDRDAPFVTLVGEARLAIQEPFAVEADLTPGDTAVVTLGSQQAKITLLDRDQAQVAGKRAACVVLTYPSKVLNGPFDIAVSDGDQAIASQGGSSRHDFDAESEQVQYLAGLGEGSHHVTVRGLRRLGMINQPIEATVDGGLLASAPMQRDRPGEQASQVTLPGGSTTLAEALTALRASGNEVLVDLGVDTGRSADLAAYQGPFWNALLHIVDTYHLDLLPPAAANTDADRNGRRSSGLGSSAQSTVRFVGGAARIGALADSALPPAIRCWANGPVLIEVVSTTPMVTRSLSGGSSDVVVAMRVRLEPCLPAEQAADAMIWWASGGMNQTASVRADVPEGMPPVEGPLSVLTLSGLPMNPPAVTVQGLLAFRLQERIQATATLELGGQTTVLLGGVPITVGLGTIRDGDQTGLTLRYVRDRFDRLEPAVTDDQGRTIESRGRSSRGHNRSVDEQWTMPGLQEKTLYTVSIATQRTRSEPSLPVQVTISPSASSDGSAP